MKLLRYTPAQIEQFKSEILGKKANIVFRDGRVSFGLISIIKADHLELKNMRMDKSVIDLKLISEIIIDKA